MRVQMEEQKIIELLYEDPEKGIHEAINLYGGKTMKSYLFEIARNTARDKRRRIKKTSVFSLDEIEMQLVAPLNMEEEFAKKTNREILQECLESLKEPDRIC